MDEKVAAASLPSSSLAPAPVPATTLSPTEDLSGITLHTVIVRCQVILAVVSSETITS